jgi:hypothetical protein
MKNLLVTTFSICMIQAKGKHLSLITTQLINFRSRFLQDGIMFKKPQEIFAGNSLNLVHGFSFLQCGNSEKRPS